MMTIMVFQHLSRCFQKSLIQRNCQSLSSERSKFVNDDRVLGKLNQSEVIIKQAMSLYKPDELMLCFNGGKDCTVLLDILAKQINWASPLRGFCVKSSDPFEEVEEFINICTERYPMQLLRYDGALKLAFEQALADQPQIRAVFLGCRRSDPGCSELAELSACDNGWPQLMRIFPLLDWNYHDIWSYLRTQKLPYCCLYDQGYTSLGERTNTRVNPSLLVYDKQRDKLTYRPAYELKDGKLERLNR